MQSMRYCDAAEGTITVLSRRKWRAVDALHAIMMDFENHGRTFYMGNWYQNATLWTLPEMLECDAEEIEVMFFGGPRDKQKYYAGTVMDYLIDCCFNEIAKGDKDMRLYRFLVEQVERDNVRAGAP